MAWGGVGQESSRLLCKAWAVRANGAHAVLTQVCTSQINAIQIEEPLNFWGLPTGGRQGMLVYEISTIGMLHLTQLHGEVEMHDGKLHHGLPVASPHSLSVQALQ